MGQQPFRRVHRRWSLLVCFVLGHAPVDGPPIRHCRRCWQVRGLRG